MLRPPRGAKFRRRRLSIENPFSAQRLRPGVLEYRFADGDSVVALCDRWTKGPAIVQIVGPHGSGKSTLLASLTHELARRGERVTLVTLRDGQRTMPGDWPALRALSPRLVIIDGYEQLGWLARAQLRYWRWRQGARLLVTAHASQGLATLYTMRMTPELAADVARALAGDQFAIDQAELESIMAANGGDLRESLFALYDRFETRRREK